MAEGFKEYGEVFRGIWSNPALLLMFGVYILFNLQTTMKSTYLSLYMVEYLQIENWLVSIFPAISSAVMLLCMWLLLPRIPQRHMYKALTGGLIVSVLGNLLLAAVSPGHLAGLTVSTILSAVGSVVIGPILETAVANVIDDENRAKLFCRSFGSDSRVHIACRHYRWMGVPH